LRLDITVQGVCTGGGHVNITVQKDSNGSKQFALRKADFQIEPSEYESVLAVLIRSRVKSLGANPTNAQIKTAIESAPFFI